jgi:mannose-1-phosphate guanylyltransferase
MAGGAGRRFWPLSRRNKPKQLLAIGTGEPLVWETVDRLLPMLTHDRIFISCGRDIARSIPEVLPGIAKKNLIIEPVGRDTAPCVGLALERLCRLEGADPERSVVAVLPADHYIGLPGKFRKTLERAALAALGSGMIMTIGIVPDRPSSAYGYIQPGAEISGEKGVFRVRRFVEKPDQRTARGYVSRGYLWNAGMFVFRLDVMRKAFREHLPKTAAGLCEIGEALGSRKQKSVIERVFPGLEKISLDYGIMEKVKNAAVVPGEFDWCDVGGWDALYRLMGGDGVKNIARGPVELVNSEGCYVEGKKLLALVGVRDLVVVETEDAILVLGKDAEAELKKLTDLLEKKGRKDLL